ncbi:MAG: S8 family serine peptidase [Acidobacteria bacterium]|nr:S8 family serine peptidase [Acidobacteriota bacterium]MBI3658571.1 S8 family serine peptidase [Acidobacteriota bacterium]
MPTRKVFCLIFLTVFSLTVTILDQVFGQEFVPNEVLVQFRPGTPRLVVDAVNIGARGIIIGTFRGDRDLYHIGVPQGSNLDSVIAYYRRNSNVRYAGRNLIIRQLETIPNDPRFSELWGLKNAGQTGGTPGADIRATFAWDVNTGDPNRVIAVIDTGVDRNHPDLASNIWVNQVEIAADPTCSDGIDHDGNGYPNDCWGWNFSANNNNTLDTNGHGTHVAGTIAAVGNNSIGVTGVMWQAKIMPVKFFPGTVATAIAGIDYARENGAKISNNSWGCLGFFLCPDPMLKQAIDRADKAEQIFVASAGNDAINVEPTIFDNKNIIGVAATDHNDNRYTMTNYGPNSIHIGGPGVNILSTVPSGNYDLKSGTSMASPHVAGVAGLMWSQNPSYSYGFVKENLLLAHRPIQSLAGLTITGGIVNAQDAINAFGDSFDDGADGSRFFSNDTTGTRWAVAQNGASRCDLFVRSFGTLDRVGEVTFSGMAGPLTATPGEAGATWTMASYKASYVPAYETPQTLKIRVTTPDGSPFTGKAGRIGVGFIGQTGLTAQICPATGLPYGQHSFGGSVIGGIELETGKPFLHFDPPYTLQLYGPIALGNLTKITISVRFALNEVALIISDSDTGAQLFTVTSNYPPLNWTGTHSGSFLYYGATAGTSGTLYVRDFLSTRP